MREMTSFKRDLFEIENARNLSVEEVVATFVPTRVFWRLLSSKNHIVLGARGSGKTALAKMISHDHLSRLKDPHAQQIIQTRGFIGIYVPTNVEWVGGLKNKPWKDEAEAEQFFQWRLNLSTCLAFLATLQSCLGTYIPNRGERARTERLLIARISRDWLDHGQHCNSIGELTERLEDLQYSKQQQLTRLRVGGQLEPGEQIVGVNFDMELFTPLRRGITLASRALQFPKNCTWILCLDEAEFLDRLHHRILNSYLRSDSKNLVFKITTMPYFHHTLDTNTGAALNVGHDFEYVYIDQDPIFGHAGQEHEDAPKETFAETIFSKRAQLSGARYVGMTLPRLLGRSQILDRKEVEWSATSPMYKLLEEHASRETRARALRMLDSPTQFADQVGRKILPALIVRDAVRNHRGRADLEIYSGASMVVRCSDANPRRLIRLFNALLGAVRWNSRTKRSLDPKAQTRILIAFSETTLDRIQSEPEVGPELFRFVRAIGTYMHDSLHGEPLTTDQISSIEVDATINDTHWKLVQRAVALGLLFPNVGLNATDQMPEREGTFHLAYALAPRFRLVPRRGRSRKLTTVLKYSEQEKFQTRPVQEILPLEHEENL